MDDDDILPLEETDPELADLLKEVVKINSQYPRHQGPIKIESDGKVYYKGRCVDNLEKVGRNDMCPCGSGKKFKKCCNKG